MSHLSRDDKTTCNICQSTNIQVFLEQLDIPILCNVLWEDKDQACNAPKGDICLAFCSNCGHVFNTSFKPEIITYTQQYENTLHCSPTFQEYANRLANNLIERHQLYGKQLIEIGCGRGDFLKLLCKIGGNKGIGFDPSYRPESELIYNDLDVQFIPDTYSDKYASYQADFIYSRHVLEHIYAPVQHIKWLHKILGDQPNAIIFFEVPNALYTLRDLGIWDIIYEHCSYFTPQSLSHLLIHNGFDILRMNTEYQDQYLIVEGKPSNSLHTSYSISNNNLLELSALIKKFNEKYTHLNNQWITNLEEIIIKNLHVVVWGAGSKGVTFLNVLKYVDAIEYIVDINPRKQGMFTAGTGHKIVAPENLRSQPPDIVILMNPIYKAEVRNHLRSLGLHPEIISAMAVK